MDNTALLLHANNMAVQASIRAQKAKEIACADFVNNFKGSLDVVLQKQYAECVEMLHPSTYSPETIILLKVLSAAAVIGFAVGLIQAYRLDKTDIATWILIPIGFTLSVPVLAAVPFLIYNAISFIFS